MALWGSRVDCVNFERRGKDPKYYYYYSTYTTDTNCYSCRHVIFFK